MTLRRLLPSAALPCASLLSSDDGNTPSAEALIANLRQLGDIALSATHIPTGHSYSDHRIVLQQAVLDFLSQLSTKEQSRFSRPAREPNTSVTLSEGGALCRQSRRA
jgi:hypothetical protein